MTHQQIGEPHQVEDSQFSRFADGADVELRGFNTHPFDWDDLSREVYCVLGIPIDKIDMPTLVRIVEDAADAGKPFLLSTANLDFLVNSLEDAEFRESLLLSELCSADGMPIVWIARLIGLPIKERVAGSDMFDILKAGKNSSRRLRIFFFGGNEGIAEAASEAIKNTPCGLIGVGSLYPGFGTIEEMSQDHLVNEINASHADFLIAALGAKKGQSWLLRNNDRLSIPVRAHLGAVINFESGKAKRAPPTLRRSGLEWLWRIKEEPHLWRRYWNDGSALLRLIWTHVIPLAIWGRWQLLTGQHEGRDLAIECSQDHDSITLNLIGAATARNVNSAIPWFREAVAANKRIRINLSETCVIDARFVGLLFMVRKRAKKQSTDMKVIGVSPRLRTMFRLNRAGFLLSTISE